MKNIQEQLQQIKNKNNLYTKEHKTFQEQIRRFSNNAIIYIKQRG
jgi:hypothetical protein